MNVQLRVRERFPLSWCHEDVKNAQGTTVKARLVGRRVWGSEIGRAVWVIEAEGRKGLSLRLIHEDGAVSFWPRDEMFDSPWAGDGLERLVCLAEHHEASAFNGSLEGLTITLGEVAK